MSHCNWDSFYDSLNLDRLLICPPHTCRGDSGGFHLRLGRVPGKQQADMVEAAVPGGTCSRPCSTTSGYPNWSQQAPDVICMRLMRPRPTDLAGADLSLLNIKKPIEPPSFSHWWLVSHSESPAGPSNELARRHQVRGLWLGRFHLQPLGTSLCVGY